jgi:purine-binding chemotaxis protein CheW
MPQNAANAQVEVKQKQATREGKYLTFSLAEEEYGISILKVKEIIGMMPITSVPQTPEFVKGVINLRGKVIPLVDLSRKFNIKPMDKTARTCIVVVETPAMLRR